MERLYSQKIRLYILASVISGGMLIFIYWLFSFGVGWFPWNSFNIGFSLSMALCLVTELIGIPYCIHRMKESFRKIFENAPGYYDRFFESFYTRKSLYSLVLVIIIPFIGLNIYQILVDRKSFFLYEGTAVSLFLDIYNYVAGYSLLILLGLMLWIILMVTEGLGIALRDPVADTVPLHLYSVDRMGGLAYMRSFILASLTVYLFIVTLLIISYVSPTQFWSFELIFTIALLFIGIWFLFTTLGRTRMLVRRRIQIFSDSLDNKIEEQNKHLLDFTTSGPGTSIEKEISSSKSLFDLYHSERERLMELYKTTRGYDLKTVVQSVIAFVLPIVAFFEKLMPYVSTVQKFLL